MKLYCEKCHKIFSVVPEDAVDGKIACPDCGVAHDVPETSCSPGTVIGDFLIESELGKGGMGEIYLARQISLDRQVALKILQARFTDDREYVEGLFREARAAAKVNHPNIVQAYAVGEDEGVYYFAMELIRGETFKQIIQREKVIAPERALQVIRQVAGAINAAWKEQRLVHQDIKPDNIMLDSNGFAKLADLGLARRAGVNDEHAEAGDEVLGTPQYISPEQLTGVPTDVRSDIYSLGATFFQMVTGRYAYVADTVEEMSHKHVDGNLEPPKSVNPDVPDSVNDIIMKMMARNIEERYQDPLDLIADIDNALKGPLNKRKGAPAVSLKLKGLGIKRKPKAEAPQRPSAPARPAAVPKPSMPPAGVSKASVPASVVKPAVAAKPETAPTVPEENKAVEETSAENKAETPETAAAEQVKPQEASVEQTSVRSALIAKHNDGAESDSEEIEELVESAAPKRSKVLVISLISLGALLVVIVGAASVLFFCHEESWMPEFARNAGKGLHALVKKDGAKPVEKKAEKTRKEVKKAPPKPVKVVPVTRQEYIDSVNALLSFHRQNPDKKQELYDKINFRLSYLMSPQTTEERRTLKPLLSIYHRLDEMLVFAPYREKEVKKFAALRKKQDEQRRAAHIAEQKRKAEEEKRKAEERARLEQERKEIEAARRQKNTALKNAITALKNPLVSGAADAFRRGDMTVFNNALRKCNEYIADNKNSKEKQIQDFRSFVKNARDCVYSFNEFVKASAKTDFLAPILISGERRDKYVHITGIFLDGTATYTYSIAADDKTEMGKTTLKKQIRRPKFVKAVESKFKRISNIKFHLLIMSGADGKTLVKNAPAKWKEFVTACSNQL